MMKFSVNFNEVRRNRAKRRIETLKIKPLLTFPTSAEIANFLNWLQETETDREKIEEPLYIELTTLLKAELKRGGVLIADSEEITSEDFKVGLLPFVKADTF